MKSRVKRLLTSGLAVVTSISMVLPVSAGKIDSEFYTSKYPEVQAALGNDSVKLQAHYDLLGKKAGWMATPDDTTAPIRKIFDATQYLELNADVAALGVTDEDVLFAHFVNLGAKEGRRPSEAVSEAAAKKAAESVDSVAFYTDMANGLISATSGISKEQEYIEFLDTINRLTTERNMAEERAQKKSSSSKKKKTALKEGDTFGCGIGGGAHIDVPEGNGDAAACGVLRNPETGDPIANARITFTRQGGISRHVDGDNEDVYVVETDEEGRYETPVLPVGNYSVKVTAEGYLNLELDSINISSSSGDFTMPTFEMLTETGDVESIKGTVKDSSTGERLANTEIRVREHWNKLDGGYEAYRANENGDYNISLNRGYYTLEFVSNGYTSNFFNISVSNRIGTRDISLSLVGDNQFRIVLEWGETPRDLDSHLVGPIDSDSAYHICYYNKTYDENSSTEVSLDIDDVTSYGPETITIMHPDDDDVYYYSVHDYTNSGSTGCKEMSESGATVTVYHGGEQVKKYYVPSNKEGKVWNVFRIEDGRIIDINNYSDDYSTIYGRYNDYEIRNDRNHNN